MPNITPDLHYDHWKEPQSITDGRGQEESFCEFCGEELPWHNVSCPMLKNAYKTRKKQCAFCPEVLQVGTLMREHVMGKHRKELEELPGVKLPKPNSF